MRPLILLTVLLCAGCAVQTAAPSTQPSATPTAAQQLSLYTETITEGLTSIANARDVGLIPQATIDAYKPAVDGVIAQRNVAERDLRSGNVTNAQSDVNQLEAALGKIAPLLTQINAAQAAKLKAAGVK
jgi:hypothetical protein